MPVLLIRHRVRDIATWQRIFDEEEATRRANGSQYERQFRSATNASEVWVFAEWDDLFRAELYVKSDEMGAALARAGVIDQPDYWYLEDTESHSP